MPKYGQDPGPWRLVNIMPRIRFAIGDLEIWHEPGRREDPKPTAEDGNVAL
jgi:hypothetical protein